MLRRADAGHGLSQEDHEDALEEWKRENCAGGSRKRVLGKHVRHDVRPNSESNERCGIRKVICCFLERSFLP